MPIVVSRQNGDIQSAPGYSQDDIDRAWEQITKAWAVANRAMLQQLAAECATEPINE